MSIEAKITGRFDNNNVQVEVKHKDGGRARYYEVPENKADSFIENYKKHHKKSSIITNTSFGGSILAGVLLTSLLTKKISNTAWKWIMNTVGGVLGASASIFISSDYLEKQNNKLLNAHNAKEIDYSA